ncbi:hypothetical protein HK104_006911, partial [Borealophlyctis nickersoniae]
MIDESACLHLPTGLLDDLVISGGADTRRGDDALGESYEGGSNKRPRSTSLTSPTPTTTPYQILSTEISVAPPTLTLTVQHHYAHTTLHIRVKPASHTPHWHTTIQLLLRSKEGEESAEVEKWKEEAARTKRQNAQLEKKCRRMFDVEEVQDVYQETADRLTKAHEKIERLERLLAEEKEDNASLRREIAHLKSTYQEPLGEYNCLLLRHEELCKKYAEQRRAHILLQAQHDKEYTAHKRLATILRTQAQNMVTAADKLTKDTSSIADSMEAVVGSEGQQQQQPAPPASPVHVGRSDRGISGNGLFKLMLEPF